MALRVELQEDVVEETIAGTAKQCISLRVSRSEDLGLMVEINGLRIRLSSWVELRKKIDSMETFINAEWERLQRLYDNRG